MADQFWSGQQGSDKAGADGGDGSRGASPSRAAEGKTDGKTELKVDGKAGGSQKGKEGGKQKRSSLGNEATPRQDQVGSSAARKLLPSRGLSLCILALMLRLDPPAHHTVSSRPSYTMSSRLSHTTISPIIHCHLRGCMGNNKKNTMQCSFDGCAHGKSFELGDAGSVDCQRRFSTTGEEDALEPRRPQELASAADRRRVAAASVAACVGQLHAIGQGQGIQHEHLASSMLVQSMLLRALP